ncbi:unnamed protein product [Camellia sinensis]
MTKKQGVKMVDQKGRGGRNRNRARILANGTSKMFNNKHNLNDIPSTNTEVQLIQQVANADYSGTPSSLPLPPPPPATGMEASSSQQPSPKRRRARKKKRLDVVGLFTQQRGEKPKHKVPPVNGGLIYMKHSLSQLTQMSNAMCFNAPTTSYYKQAHAIHNLAKRLFNNLKNDLKAINMEYSLPRRHVRRSQVEGGCLGTKLYAKLSGFRDGQNVNLCETERRQTYKPLTSIFNEKSIFSMFHSSLKQLVPGNGGIKYKESLMQFVNHLGPTAQKMANQKLKCLTQTPSHHFQGSSLQFSSLAAQQRPSCRERIINVVTPYANNSLGIHDASSREKNILPRVNIDINSNACRGHRVLGVGIWDPAQDLGDGTNPYVGAYGRHTTLIGWANFQGDTTRIHSALQWARAGGTDKKVIDQTLNDMASIIGPSSDGFKSQSRLVELLCGGNRHPKSSVYPLKVVNPSLDYKATLAQVTEPPLKWNQPTPRGPQAMYDFSDINPLGQDVFGKPNGVNLLDQDDQDVELQLALAQSMQPHKPHNVIVFGQEALSQLGLQIMPSPYVQPQPGLLIY